jgi:uncharacterized membrane protein YfcA
MSLITALFAALAVFGIYYAYIFYKGITVAGAEGQPVKPTALGIAIGAVTNFFDNFGVGSFATTTSIFRATDTVRDEKIPGTLNVGHTIPTFVEAIAATALFKTAIDTSTLVQMIAAAVAGAWLGAKVFGGWPRRNVQIGMGLALLAAVGIMLTRMLLQLPDGNLTQLVGMKLIIALAVQFILGMLMTLGIGLYAPCMILVSILGMNITAAFPIMMGSCAFLMPVASGNFIKLKSYDPRASMGLLIGGVPGVLISAYIVKSMNVDWLKWLVVIVVTYTSMSMLLTARRERLKAGSAPAAAH